MNEFLNVNNEWCEGKHSPTMNKVYTKGKTVKVAEFERVFKIHVALGSVHKYFGGGGLGN